MRLTKIIFISSLLFVFLIGNASGEEVRSFAGRQTKVYSVAFSPDGRYFLSGDADQTLKLWDLAKGKQIRTFTGHNGLVDSIAFSPDGRQFLSGDRHGTIKLWDVTKGEEIQTFTRHKDAVLSVAFSPERRQQNKQLLHAL